jgi:hypothetical protein
MRSKGLIVGAACGLALGAGVIAAVDAGTEPASAQGGFTVSAAQLKINQNISSAAVKRGNRALNYLAPVRTAASDNADTGSNGVKPLSTVPGSGQGWTTQYVADDAITTSKLSDGVMGKFPKWATKTGNGADTTGRKSNEAYVIGRDGVGAYYVDWGMNVSQCGWNAVPSGEGNTPPNAYEIKTWYDPAQPNRVKINTYSWDNVANAYQPVESGWQVQAYCD